MIRIAALLLPLMCISCGADLRPGVTQAQFKEIVKNCGLPSKVRLEREGRDHPMIILTDTGMTDAHIACIRAEQERLGATADMAN